MDTLFLLEHPVYPYLELSSGLSLEAGPFFLSFYPRISPCQAGLRGAALFLAFCGTQHGADHMATGIREAVFFVWYYMKTKNQ